MIFQKPISITMFLKYLTIQYWPFLLVLHIHVIQVKIGLRVLTRPLPEQLPTVYRTLGENFNERVLPSIIHETLKAVVAQYNASQLITQREVRHKPCPYDARKLWYIYFNRLLVADMVEKYEFLFCNGYMLMICLLKHVKKKPFYHYSIAECVCF